MVSIQRVVLLALTGAFRTTNTAALQVLMHAAPIDLELERLNAEFRLFTLRRHVAFGSLRYRPQWVALPHKDVVPHPSLPAVAPFRRLSRRAACNICRAPGVHIYTDGSYTSLSAGAAYVVLDPNPSIMRVGRFRLLAASSAYAAEVVAFIEALRHVLEARYTTRVAMYTDCLSLLQALASPHNVEPHVVEIRQLLNTIRRRSPVHLYHVPGHSGVFGNEVADHLSQRATRVGLLRRLPSPFRAVRRQFRQELLVLWTDRWRADFRRTELYRWVQDLRVLPSFFPPPQPLVTLLTGHGRFPQYFYRFGLMRYPRCPCGAYSVDMSHVLHACAITTPYTSRIRPHEALSSGRYADVLQSPRNRALLIRAVCALSEAIPHVGT
ncbi:hypothetical protein HPB52_001690 [Rhipicephalus sanguineus]|uniref:RNase H type-1 domain-containing protein n=1 Tax=Rhipicephalus sanguineus TaxID=34632 RepID=A0A9D4SRE2_RHISA|nr:hypothetical protein HPB52_001690 [Rhipicephalus sanguineus]